MEPGPGYGEDVQAVGGHRLDVCHQALTLRRVNAAQVAIASGAPVAATVYSVCSGKRRTWTTASRLSSRG